MEAFEWEERDEVTPLYVHVVAGSMAGISEHLSMIPIDNVKTHCQATRDFPIAQIVKKIYRAGGLTNFYAGSSVVAFGCAPAHAIYFSIYQHAKQVLNCDPDTDVGKFAFVGALSAMFHDLMMTPTETLKQRLQLMRSENAKITIKEVFQTVRQREGLMAFYRSFPVNYAMNIPFGSLIIVFNEKLKHLFKVKQSDHGINYYLCGATAGGIASIPTTPLDVIKTKLNTQNCLTHQCEKIGVCNVLMSKIESTNSHSQKQADFKSKRGKIWMQSSNKMMSTAKNESIKYRNVLDTCQTIWKEQGFKGFFKGIKMRMAIQSVSSGVSWGTYQIMKNFLFTPQRH